MPEVVLVTEKEFRKGEAIFAAERRFTAQPAPAAEERLAAEVRAHAARGVIVGGEVYSGPLYEALAATGAGEGALIARFGVGHDGIDKLRARQCGIVVTNTPGTLEASVAEHAFWLLGSLTRRLCQLDRQFRAGQFEPSMGSELCGKVLGVVGFGVIGRKVAAIAHFGFGMQVLAVDTRSPADLERQEGRPLAELLAARGVAQYTTDLGDVLRQADAVSIHLPSTPQTRHLFDAGRLALMKPTALLVNTARGAVLDELALYDALAGGRLAGAALDVFENEPYRPVAPDKDLRSFDNVVLTPHTSSSTREANSRMARAAAENAAKFLQGRYDELSCVDRP
jgi:lactate dehydrogenase-like 2-hydroxyacid dehydrogenase